MDAFIAELSAALDAEGVTHSHRTLGVNVRFDVATDPDTFERISNRVHTSGSWVQTANAVRGA